MGVMVNIKKCKILYIMASIVLTVTLLLSSVDFDAAEFEQYSSSGINSMASIRYSSGSFENYVEPDDYGALNFKSNSFQLNYTFILMDGYLYGDSVLQLGLVCGLEVNTFTSFSVSKLTVFDDKWNPVNTFSANDFNITYETGSCILLDSNELKINSSKNVSIKYIQIVLNCSVTSLKGYCSCSDFYLNYSKPNFDKDIYENLEDVVSPTPEDKEQMDDIKDNMGSQSSEIEDLLGSMDDLNRPSGNDFNTDLSGIVSNEAIAMFSKALSVITESKLVLSMMTIVFTIGVVGYALFGKRG